MGLHADEGLNCIDYEKLAFSLCCDEKRQVVSIDMHV